MKINQLLLDKHIIYQKNGPNRKLEVPKSFGIEFHTQKKNLLFRKSKKKNKEFKLSRNGCVRGEEKDLSAVIINGISISLKKFIYLCLNMWP